LNLKRLLKHDNAPILLVFLGMILVVFLVELFVVRGGDISSVAFVRPMNVSNALMQVAITGILAIGMTLVMISGGIDLSVGQMMSFIGVLTAYLIRNTEMSDGTIILVIIVISVSFELLMGFIISRTTLEPFIISLGFMSIYRGFTYVITGGRELSIHGSFTFLGQSYIGVTDNLRFGMPVVLFLGLVVLVWLLSRYTKFGRRVYALGDNENAAFLAGIDVKNFKLMLYGINGFFVAIASLALTSRLGTGNPLMGSGREIEVIAAVVVGGTALSGGKGNIWGTLIGAFLLGIISNALNILGVSPYWQFIMRGVLIIGAVVIGYLSSTRSWSLFSFLNRRTTTEEVESGG
jgi:ribose/xylose/arabinose/galactoside ABC-type transport system permease subunit